jgi:hypothetical protein
MHELFLFIYYLFINEILMIIDKINCINFPMIFFEAGLTSTIE